MPRPDEISLSPDPAYVHLTSNETIQGVQWHAFPDVGGRPLVADMSSDILSRPFDAGKFALIYAGAQKNLGPSGVTAVLLRESWLAKANKAVPTMLRYATHVKNNSLYNTPPSFGVYVLGLVLQWIEKAGGLAAMAERNGRKARDRLRRHRPQRRLLPRPRRAGVAVADERHLPPARRGEGEAVPRRGAGGRHGRPGRATAPSAASAPRSTTPSARRPARPWRRS